jgi:hypothetical protein
MEVIKNLFLFRWYTPPQELEDASRSISHVSQIAASARKMELLEKEIPLPEEFRFGASQPAFIVLCEDAIMFYTVRSSCSSIRTSLI